MTFLLVGLFGIVNGYDTPLISRDVAVVAKANRNNYVNIRAWPPSPAVVKLMASREVYGRLAVHASTSTLRSGISKQCRTAALFV
jgi:hypothetical protein